MATPPDVPFIVHAAKGSTPRPPRSCRGSTRSAACANTVLVHGVALTPDGWDRVLGDRRQPGLVSGVERVPVRPDGAGARVSRRDARRLAHVCLGTDSRVTGSRDLLDELRAAAAASPSTARELLRMVTTRRRGCSGCRMADALRLASRPTCSSSHRSHRTPRQRFSPRRRRDVMLVTIGGDPIVGAPSLRAAFAARRTAVGKAVVDGAERLVSCAARAGDCAMSRSKSRASCALADVMSRVLLQSDEATNEDGLARIGRMGALFMGSNVARGAAAFATSVVIARTLGPDAFGRWTLCVTWAAMLTFLLDLGFGVMLTRDAAGGTAAPGALVGAALAVRMAMFVPVAVLFLAVAPALGLRDVTPGGCGRCCCSRQPASHTEPSPPSSVRGRPRWRQSSSSKWRAPSCSLEARGSWHGRTAA